MKFAIAQIQMRRDSVKDDVQTENFITEITWNGGENVIKLYRLKMPILQASIMCIIHSFQLNQKKNAHIKFYIKESPKEENIL